MVRVLRAPDGCRVRRAGHASPDRRSVRELSRAHLRAGPDRDVRGFRAGGAVLPAHPVDRAPLRAFPHLAWLEDRGAGLGTRRAGPLCPSPALTVPTEST